MTGTAVEIIEWLMNQKDKESEYDIDLHREKRSLNANSYFHVLVDKLRQKEHISMARCKNQLICDYGQILYLDDGVPMIYKTNAPPEFVQELEEPHMKLVKTQKEGDKEVFFYRVYRGSSTYNTKEMSQLIEGTVMDCKDHDIETATPLEISHMMDLWRKTHG